jgi:hypothetical protein
MRRVLLPALAATLVLSLSGCSDDESSKGDAKSSSKPTESESSRAPAKMKVAKVKPETIKDDAFGHTIKATRIVRNFPFPETMAGMDEGGDAELVLVNVQATAGKKYVVPLSEGDFRLSTKRDDPRGGTVATTMTETAMTDAGYPPFGEVGKGKSGGGWLAFPLEHTTDGPLYLSYKRLAFDKGKVPEEVVTVPLTPAN